MQGFSLVALVNTTAKQSDLKNDIFDFKTFIKTNQYSKRSKIKTDVWTKDFWRPFGQFCTDGITDRSVRIATFVSVDLTELDVGDFVTRGGPKSDTLSP